MIDWAPICQVAYQEADGHLSVFTKSTNYGNCVLIGEGPDRIISCFCRWTSKINNLSVQPDKPWDYVGDKPPVSKIQQDFTEFTLAYQFIKPYKL